MLTATACCESLLMPLPCLFEGFCRACCLQESKFEDGRAEDDDGAIRERGRCRDEPTVQHRSILAPQIFKDGAMFANGNPRMLPRDADGIDDDCGVVRASEDVFTARHGNFT